MLFLIHGENQYESWQRVLAITSGNHSLLNGDSLDSLNPIFTSSDTVAMFAEVSPGTVVVKRFFQNKKKSLQDVLLNELQNRSNLPEIVFWEAGKADARTKLFKFLQKKGGAEEHRQLDERQLADWVTVQLKQQGISISRQIAEKVLAVAGPNQHILQQELHKLALAAKSDNRSEVNAADLQLLAPSTVETNRWDLVDALAGRNRKQAIAIVNELLQTPQDFHAVAGLIGWQLRMLYLASRRDLSQDDLAALGVKGFALQKARRYLSNFPQQRIAQLYDKLAQLDLSVKEGRIDGKLGLNLLLASL